MNLFYALTLPKDLQALLGQLRRSDISATWARPEGFHLTLAFLGPRSPDHVSELLLLAQSVAKGHAKFVLKTAELGAFPHLRRPRVLWLGVTPEPALEALVQDLRSALVKANITFDAKPFKAHITLARFKRPMPLQGLPSPPSQYFAAEAIALFRSHPKPDGVCYEQLGSVSLVS